MKHRKSKTPPAETVDLYAFSGASSRLKKRKKIRLLTNIIASIVLALSVLATGVLGAYLGLSGLQVGGLDMDEETGDFENLTYSSDKNVSYILVVGVDVSENLSDIIVVVCVDHKKNTINCLQIPRDTFVGTDVPSTRVNAVYGSPREGESKINALRRKLASHFGIPIDHYIVFTIHGFMNIVDALGGLDINITQKTGIDIEDQITYQHHTIGPGWVHLDGNMATGFVRKRKGGESGYSKGDISRLEAQRLMYVALVKKMKDMSLTQMASVAKNCYNDVATDLTVNEIVGYAGVVKPIPFESIGVYAVPGQGCTYQKRSLYSIHKADYVQLFNEKMNPYGAPITVDGIRIRELHTELGLPTTGSLANAGGTLAEVITEHNQGDESTETSSKNS